MALPGLVGYINRRVGGSSCFIFLVALLYRDDICGMGYGRHRQNSRTRLVYITLHYIGYIQSSSDRHLHWGYAMKQQSVAPNVGYS